MKQQKVLLVILAFVLALNFGCAKEEEELSDFRTDSEPKGFRYKWETNVLAVLDEMRFVGTQIHPHDVMYTKRGEDLQLEGIEVVNIEYSFWKDKFYAVTIYSRGETNFNLVRKYLFTEFGVTKNVEQHKEWSRYTWVGKETRVELRYIISRQLGRLRIELKEIANEVEKESQKYLISGQQKMEEKK